MLGPGWHRIRLSAVVGGCVGSALIVTGCATTRPVASAQHLSPALVLCARADVLGVRYLQIAQAGNRRLEMDFDGLHGRDRNNLAAAELDLNDAAATEHLFDRRLRRIALPPAIEEVARALIRVNEARANLTTTAASATTIRQLRNQEPGVTAAD